jgi:hypothetical protein
MIAHVIRLAPGTDLSNEIDKFLSEKNIEAAYIAMGIGSLSSLKVRFASADDYAVLKENFEIVSLSGSLSKNGTHIHGSFSNSNGKVIGGHVRQGCLVRTTAELVIVELKDYTFERVMDAQTGYMELIPRKKEKA